MDTTSATYPAPVYDPATGAAIDSNSPGVVYPAVVYPTTSTGTSTSSTLNPSSTTTSDVRATASQKAQTAQEKTASAAETAKIKASQAAQTAKAQASGVAHQVASHPIVQNGVASVQAQVSALDSESVVLLISERRRGVPRDVNEGDACNVITSFSLSFST